MIDARWIEVFDDVASARLHFEMAVALHEAGGFDAPGIDGYRSVMAFMHAMQSGHTSLEAALLRVMNLLGEEKPSGESWYADLIRRAGRDLDARPAILSKQARRDADETRRFRNVATRSYDSFSMDRTGPAVEAADRLASSFEEELRRFQSEIDPPEDDGEGDGSGGSISGGPS